MRTLKEALQADNWLNSHKVLCLKSRKDDRIVSEYVYDPERFAEFEDKPVIRAFFSPESAKRPIAVFEIDAT